MFFISKLRFAYIVSIGFLNEEYLIAPVDFIVALRRTKGRGRRTLRSPPSPSSGLHLIHPGCPLRRGMTAAAVYTNLGIWYQVQVDNPHFDVMFGCLVFGLRSLAFQKISLGFGRLFFIGGGMDCSCLRLRGVLPWICVELPLTATLCQFRMVQAHFTNNAGCKNTVKNALVRLKLQGNRYSIQAKPLTIQLIPHRLSSF